MATRSQLGHRLSSTTKSGIEPLASTLKVNFTTPLADWLAPFSYRACAG
ncbi:hypothetical protein [Cesiribacter sp. SM1]|nr:hypothetical protein [Cesiribacter sp. SM1]